MGIHGSGRVPVLVPWALGWGGTGPPMAGANGGLASGYKIPEVLGVLACGTAFARPFVITPDTTEFELTFGLGSQPRFRELAL